MRISSFKFDVGRIGARGDGRCGGLGEARAGRPAHRSEFVETFRCVQGTLRYIGP
jgi:hypothetical protein